MNSMKRFRIIFSLAALFCLNFTYAQLETLAAWDFENSSIAPSSGTGTFARVGTLIHNTTSPGPYFNGADPSSTACPLTSMGIGYSVTSFSTSNTSYRGVSFTTSTIGATNLKFEFDIRQSNSAPNTFAVYYTTTAARVPISMTTVNTTYCGGTLVTNSSNQGVIVATLNNDDFKRVTIDLSAITALNNQSTVKLEILAVGDPNSSNAMKGINGGAVATGTNGGAWRFDNIKISAYKKIKADMSGAVSICTPNSANISATIIGGQSPYTLVYTDGTNNYTQNGYISGTNISVSPTVNTTYSIVSVTDAINTAALAADITGSSTVTVHQGLIPGNIEGFTPTGTNIYNLFICFGESLTNDVKLVNYQGTITKWQVANNNAFTLGLQEFTGTDFLTPSQIGVITAPKFIRAVVSSSNCGTVNVTLNITQRTVTWTGSVWSGGSPNSGLGIVVNGNLTVTTSLEGCSLTINSGTVSVQPGAYVSINGIVTVNAPGTLVFEDNSSLIQNLDVANVGVITYKRKTTPVKRYDYTYWSTPVKNQILANFSPETLSDKYYWWDPSIYNWANITAPGISLMENAKGYIIRSPQSFSITASSVWEGAFIGTPNNGSINATISVSGANNLNLVGNPYPSAIDADLFLSDPANASALGTGGSLYFWTHNTPITNYQYTFSDYAVYNFMGGIGTSPANGSNSNIPNGKIASGQGFFLEAQANGNVVFKNSMRLKQNNDRFYRTSSTEKDRFWIELSNQNNGFKQSLIGYTENATNGVDAGYDAPLNEGSSSVQLYSIIQNNPYSIQAKSLPFRTDDVIRLGFSTDFAGQHNITLALTEGIFRNQEVYLKDKETNTFHLLNQSPYSFESGVGRFESRFEIYFVNQALSVNSSNDSNNAIRVFQNNQTLTVKSTESNLETISLFDLTGRLIHTSKGELNNEYSYYKTQPTQPLLVQIKLKNGSTIIRKTIF